MRISIELGGNWHRHPGTIIVIVPIFVFVLVFVLVLIFGSRFSFSFSFRFSYRSSSSYTTSGDIFYCSGSRQLNHSSFNFLWLYTSVSEAGLLLRLESRWRAARGVRGCGGKPATYHWRHLASTEHVAASSLVEPVDQRSRSIRPQAPVPHYPWYPTWPHSLYASIPSWCILQSAMFGHGNGPQALRTVFLFFLKSRQLVFVQAQAQILLYPLFYWLCFYVFYKLL